MNYTRLLEAPTVLRPGLDSGDLGIFGGVVRDLSTGKIAGHMQETSLMSRGVNAATGLLSGPAGAVRTASSLVANAQLVYNGPQKLDRGLRWEMEG